MSSNNPSHDVAIRVQNVSKHYQIYDNPGDRLKQFLLPRINRLLGRPTKQYFREFKALEDVSFEIKKGETVGIIGKNGSGKSTLLQIICGTLTPTSGQVRVNGRVAALLELGSGFNPEFTGRENVYLNASVLGLTKEEIDARYDAIAAFADIGDFINQPVKTYSSGMFVRLAFAVIAHVDADILIVDEALSVGDAIFGQKCMRFIREFQKNGTLLFVSHDNASVVALCQNAIWLNEGLVLEQGESKPVTEKYLQYSLQKISGDSFELKNLNEQISQSIKSPEIATSKHCNDYQSRAKIVNNLTSSNGWRTGKADITQVNLTNLTCPEKPVLLGGETVQLKIRALAHADLTSPIIGFLFKDRLGQDLFGENTLVVNSTQAPLNVAIGHYLEAQFIFTLPMLPNGKYAVMASIADGDLHNNTQHHWLHDALIVEISSSKVRWGLVGLPFQSVDLRILTNS